MSRTIDYFIDSENDLARFEFYFEEELNIKSVTLKSIMFYNSWWTGDSFANSFLYTFITDITKSITTDEFRLVFKEFAKVTIHSTEDFLIPQRHFS